MTNGTQAENLRATSGELSLVATRGDRSVLLAMDLPEAKAERLAGFALYRALPGKAARPLYNRLDFKHAVMAETKPEDRKWHPSDQAPFQKFRWVDVPPDIRPGIYEYTAMARYFAADGSLVDGPSASIRINLMDDRMEKLEVGFTRGYISSQAYADKFHNKPFEPSPATMNFDTKPYETKYEWLGFHARELLMGFLDGCLADPTISVDAFAYDLNEPDIVRRLATLGPRLRLFLDNSTLHVGTHLEPLSQAAIVAGGAAVKVGHFGRFAHNKVFIAKRGNNAVRVLTGSANFSVRGLYVQSNNVLVFDSPTVAELYETAFEQSWTSPAAFRKAAIAKAWFPLPTTGLPVGRVAFSPHADATLSLKPVVDALTAAKSSAMFAVMGLSGGGDVLAALRTLADRDGIFSYGVSQTVDDVALYKPGSRRGIRIPFGFLSANVPEPFTKEWKGGDGQVIHHKFIVIDFNGTDPVVYTGSSNLASGGEKANGDNLIELRGREIASLYAVEAVRQIDHYHFRAVKMKATGPDDGLVLKGPDEWEKWVKPYYDANDLKSVDRALFVR
jgi:PLD-like domain